MPFYGKDNKSNNVMRMMVLMGTKDRGFALFHCYLFVRATRYVIASWTPCRLTTPVKIKDDVISRFQDFAFLVHNSHKISSETNNALVVLVLVVGN